MNTHTPIEPMKTRRTPPAAPRHHVNGKRDAKRIEARLSRRGVRSYLRQLAVVSVPTAE